jgi:hypothetical protein
MLRNSTGKTTEVRKNQNMQSYPPCLFISTSKCATSYIRWQFKDTGMIGTDNVVWLTDDYNNNILRKHKKSFKFTIVRNPYSRAYSCWKYATTKILPTPTTKYQQQHGGHALPPNMTFEDFLKLDMYQAYYDNKISLHALTHILPLFDYLKTHMKIIDYFAKVETLQQDVTWIAEKIGWTGTVSSDTIVYDTPQANLQEKTLLLQDPKIIALINQRYQQDFVNFGYSTDL